MEGYWQVTVDDVVLTDTNWAGIVSALSTMQIDVVRDFDFDLTSFTNNSTNLYRLRFEPLDATVPTVSDSNSNPTVLIDADIVTFCLAGAS